jgi:hypothetical protein
MTGSASPRVLEAGARLERNALAGVVAPPQLRKVLAELGPDHFDDDEHRRLRAHLVAGDDVTNDLVPVVAELDARAAEEAIDEQTGMQLLLRLRERRLRRELAAADEPRSLELQETLQEIRETFEQLAALQPPP